MTVKLAVAGVIGIDRILATHAVRLTDSKGYCLPVTIKGAPKRLKIVSAIEPKAHHARARQINVGVKVDGYTRAQELLLVLWI